MQAYITWLDPVTLSEVTKPRYGSVYPWPLNTVLTYLKVAPIHTQATLVSFFLIDIDFELVTNLLCLFEA